MADEASEEGLDAEMRPFGSLRVPHYDELKGFFQQRVYGHHDVEDLTQETYARFLGWWSGPRFEYPRSLLFRIARNLLTDRVRRANFRKEEAADLSLFEDLAVNEQNPCERARAKEELQLARETVDRLPRRCREAFILSRFGGLSNPEIAKHLGISRSTVEKHIMAAISAVRDSLDTD
ncbi:MAG: RNA polymerase sigma factor [Verrucomicrobiota bacterium]